MALLLRLRNVPTGRILQASRSHDAHRATLRCRQVERIPTRPFASNDGGFFGGLKKIFDKEVEENAELKATLERLQKKTDPADEKAKEKGDQKENSGNETQGSASEHLDKAQQLREEASRKAEELREGAEDMFKQAKDQNEYVKAGAGMFEQFQQRFSKKEEKTSPEGEQAGAQDQQEKKSFLEGFKGHFKEAYDGLWEAPSKSDVALKKHLADNLAPSENKAKKKSRTFDDNAPSALVQVEPDKTTWQKLQQRLYEAPIIQEILSGAKAASESNVGQAVGGTIKGAKNRVSDVREDVSEYWETSQNPWVYRISSIYDGMFGQTEESIAVEELRRLDPSFNLYEWKDKIGEIVVPQIVNETYSGRFDKVDEWCTEALGVRFKNLVQQRKEHGLIVDSVLMETEDFTVLNITAEHKGAPVIILQCMTQVLHCIRNREGEILEGGEEDVRAIYYAVAFQRFYNPDDQSLEWKVIDFQEVGSMGYI